MKDTLGRNIDYLRISLTDRCNLRCIYCMPEEGVASIGHDRIMRLEEIERIVRVAASLGIKHIRLTGGEPLVRKGICGLVDNVAHTPGIESVALTTNGILLPKMADDLKAAGLSRVNISLDTLDPNQYHFITRWGNLQDVLDGIDAALEAGFDPVKINAVVVRSLNQDFLGFARMTVDRPLHVRFIEYMPVGESAGYDGSGWGPDDVVASEDLRRQIAEEAKAAGLGDLMPADKDRPSGWGPAQYWRLPGAKGTLGFISPLSNHFCGSCNRIRLTADGKIRPCLFSDVEYDMMPALRDADGNPTPDDEAIRDVIVEAIGAKPDAHHDRVGTERKMSQIGG
jgi:cyclic pyranopterin phosphate synthase